MKLLRLADMGMSEIADRGRQQSRKWLDRSRLAFGVGRRAGGRRAMGVPGRSPGEDLAARFFEGAADAAIPGLIAARLPGARDSILAGAGRIARGRFDLLGYRGLSFGDPIDWHLDPVAGRRAPIRHWSRIDPLDARAVGDSKIVWELNRHQWLVRLGQAYRLTGDAGLADRFAACVRAWREANPPGVGINWASSLEASLRLISWCWAMVLFRGARALTPDLRLEMVAGIADHASHVERYLSRWFSPNTHLTGEALGLFYAGALFPELPGAKRWRLLGAGILEEESGKQVLPDGVHFEQATCYQMYTIEILIHFLVLADRIGVTVAPAVARRVRRMIDFLLAIRRPDGTIPPIGDGDGGRLLPLAQRGPEDARGLFATAAALFARADYAWAAGGPAPEILWILGARGLEVFESLRPEPPAVPASRLFPTGGYAVMRDGWSPEGHHLVFDLGPIGCPVSAGHGHADLLSVQCAAYGRPFLVDAGTGCYTADARLRDHFRSTAAHSTVVIDGRPQADPAGPFAWRDRPRARLRRWLSTGTFDLVDAEHDAYGRLPDPVRHRRRVVFVRTRYIVLIDDLEGAADHDVEIRFQFAPLLLTVGPDLWARARGDARRGLHLRPFAAAPLAAEIREGAETPPDGWVSTDYGLRRPAPVLIYRAVARLPLRVATLIIPTRRPDSVPTAATPIFDGDPVVGIRLDGFGESVRFGADDVEVERG